MSESEIAIRAVLPEDINDWAEYVAQHPDATAYHQYAWINAVEKAYKFESNSLIARDEKTQRVVGVFPAVLMTIPLSGKSICALPYCDVGYGLADNEQILNRMTRQLQEQLTSGNAKQLEIRSVNNNSNEPSDFKNKKVRMLLALPESSELLMASFKSKLRSQIRKAEKNGLTTKLGADEQLLDHFYSVYVKNMRDLGSPVHAKKWFIQILNAYKNDCVIGVVYNDNTPIGGGLVIKKNNKASIPWASTLRDYNKLAPNMLLYWSLLAHCADTGINTFDFGRSTFEEGTFKFKKQWGAQPQLLDWKSFNANGEIEQFQANSASSTSKLKATAESVWRKLPLKVTITIGSTIRPYISL